MDLFRRFFGSHNSRPAPKNGPSDPTGQGNQLSLTVLFRRRWLKLEIGQSGERGDDEPTAAEPDIAVAEGEASGNLARIMPPQAQADERRPDLGEPAQQDAATVSFWDALDPTEREALRSIADWRTFAAGAVLMQEGDRADHVIVILGGRTKICVNEHGHERVLAVRGVGQLVGERGALQVSVRSATVIALDMVLGAGRTDQGFRDFSQHPSARARTRSGSALRPAHRRVGWQRTPSRVHGRARQPDGQTHTT